MLCAEGYHVTRKDVLNLSTAGHAKVECARPRDAQAQREPERVSQP